MKISNFRFRSAFVGSLLLGLLSGVVATKEGKSPTEELPNSITNFTINMLRAANTFKEENVAFSPFCISLQLGTLQQAAKGASGKEIESVLGFGPAASKQRFHDVLEHLEKTFYEDVMHWGNHLYVRDEYEFESDFETVMERSFNTLVKKVDFANENASQVINERVRKATDGRIEDVVDSGSISPDTSMILVSAIYFSDEWDTEFNVRDTEENLFHLNQNKSVTVPFMIRRNVNMTFGEDSKLGAKWISLGYAKGSSVMMLLVLPKTKFGLGNVLSKLTIQNVNRMMKESRQGNNATQGSIFIPKFNISGKMILPKYMKELGIKKIFTPNANLTGMVKNELVQVSDMIHECRIEVNEKGTTAASVSTTKFQFLSGSLTYPEVNAFKADEPFLFFIFDKSLQLLLFAGKISSPEAE